jgi:lysophospholipase L1-like esterase
MAGFMLDYRPVSLAVLRRGGAAPPPPAFNTIVIEGDSITRSIAAPGEAEADTAGYFSTLWKATATGKTVHIRAVSSRAVGTSANLNDNGNSLFGNVAEDMAYAPDLITYKIGANDFSVSGGTTAAQYRSRLIDLFAVYKAARPAVKVAWSPPLAYNPTGTPHPGKAWFDEQRAAVLSTCRDPAVWSQWCDFYMPLGEYPDFGDNTASVALFETSDPVHPNGAGHLLLRDGYSRFMDSLIDTARASSTTPYNSVWPASETNLARSTEIVRRFIVSGLAREGTALGVSVSGGGSPQVRLNGGAYASSVGTGSGNGHRIYNGDVVDLKLTTSASFETATSVSLTIGSETRAISYTTAADVSPAAYVHGDLDNSAGGAAGTTRTLTGRTFAAGKPVIFVLCRAASGTSAAPTSVTVGGVAATLRHFQNNGGTTGCALYEAPEQAGGNLDVVVTFSQSSEHRMVGWGTLQNATFSSAGGNAPGSQNEPFLTPTFTVPTNGLALALFAQAANNPITLAACNAPTVLVENKVITHSGADRGLCLGRHDSAVNGPASFDFNYFTNLPRLYAVWTRT